MERRGRFTSIMREETNCRCALQAIRATGAGTGRFIRAPAHPYGEGLWPIPALGIGYTETKIVEMYDFMKAVSQNSPADPDFKDGYQIELIGDAVINSAENSCWVDVEKVK